MHYRFETTDRNYGSYLFINKVTSNAESLDVDPITHKLLHGDIVDIKEGNVCIVSSPCRESGGHCGILVLEKNKSYGKDKGTYLYRCIPDDKRIPCFIVPYKLKVSGFSKLLVNRYITFSYRNWDGKHPSGMITESYGEVDKVQNTFEYLIRRSNSRHSTRRFCQYVHQHLKNRSENSWMEEMCSTHGLVDRTEDTVMTIDPEGCQDFDDAVGIRVPENGEGLILSVYIANVSLWMTTLDAWSHLTDQVSTMYLPKRVCPMLPACLSNNLCSLQAERRRVVLAMDVYIQDGCVERIEYKNAIIRVSVNYVYEEESLIQDPMYVSILQQVQSLNWTAPYLTDGVNNSHDVVAYLMLMYNHRGGCELSKHKAGMYRVMQQLPVKESTDSLPTDISAFFKVWNRGRGEYTLYGENMRHDALGVDSYCHLSSPIRRLVDLLNQIEIQNVLGLVPVSAEAQDLVDKWRSRMLELNESYRSIRKLQSTYELLYKVHEDETVLQSEYEACVFDRSRQSDTVNDYSVYIPGLKLMSRISSSVVYEERQLVKVKLYLFKDEHTTLKKVRVEIVLP
jgi:exoribonuclease R